MGALRFQRPRAEDAARHEWAYSLDGAAGGRPGGNDWVAATATIPQLFSAEECRRIRDLGNRLELAGGYMTRPGFSERKCLCAWMRPEAANAWIYERIAQAVREANQNYGFDLLGMMDPLQFTLYDARTRDEIGWHTDCGEGPNTTRKLSLTVQLSSPDDYEGGDLEFLATPASSFMRHQGAAILFPALLAHRVTPVTRGRRYSLVAFMNGPPFR